MRVRKGLTNAEACDIAIWDVRYTEKKVLWSFTSGAWPGIHSRLRQYRLEFATLLFSYIKSASIRNLNWFRAHCR
jgi:hypothetical protein